MIKQFITGTLCCLLISHHIVAQTLPAVDKSPMDVSYYPVDYPRIEDQGQGCRTLRSKSAVQPSYLGIIQLQPVDRCAAHPVPVQLMDKPVESLAMTFDNQKAVPQLVIAWDNIKVALPFNP